MKRFLHRYDNEHLTTMNTGNWIPVNNFIAIPNESLKIGSDVLLRTQPLLSPTYSRYRASLRIYGVPIRKIWTDFDKFRTLGPDGDSSIVAPYITAPAVTGWLPGDLPARLGAAIGVPNNTSTALFVRAYNEVYNHYIRDKDLQPERVINRGNGSDTTTDVTLANVCWDRDNYNTARPYPQKGDAVSIPLTGDAPVIQDANLPIGIKGVTSGTTRKIQHSTSTITHLQADGALTNTELVGVDSTASGMITDLSDVSAVNINDLRTAAAVQRFKELMSRFVGEGTLNEFYRLFGVAPKDLRMQFPERIGGGDSVIQFSEVLQTAEGTDPVGELRGHGIGTLRGNRVHYFVEEDMIILVMLSVAPPTVYMQGQNKQHDLTSTYDYPNPAIQNLGQQPILNKEIDASHAQPDGVFGWQDQNYWLRRAESRVSGEFFDTLKFWHSAIEYETPPALNGDFVECLPSDRIFAAGSAAAQLQLRVWNKVKRKNWIFPQGRPALR